MEASRWQRAKHIFDAALDSPIPSRNAFVAKACGGDAEMQRLVEELLVADYAAGSFMKTGWLNPAAPTQEESYFVPGDVVSGRYRIVRTLGGGGMGQVYEAVDSELNVRVALKTIRPEISSSPEVLVRFRQEVRLAHRITHPNVCRTFHLDREVRESTSAASGRVEINFLTMEYLRGETLRSLLKAQGPLAPQRALAIASQIAAAIKAAHRAGIIHRDIKPANIMIVPLEGGTGDERVVVTDFGLARWQTADPDASSISQQSTSMSRHVIGTLAYMAPEQLQGGTVSPATDIYALGLVLYEMVTGKKAFTEMRSLAATNLETETVLSSLIALSPDMGREWQIAISGCLHADAADRFQSADEVMAALEGWAPTDGGKSRILANSRTERSRVKPKLIIAAVVFTAVASLFAAGMRLYIRRQASTVSEGALVYLAPIRNETGEKELDDLTELVREGLAQSAQITLLDEAKESKIFAQMMKEPNTPVTPVLAREIGMRAGAVRVFFATVTGSDGKYHLNFDIQQPDMTPANFRYHWSHTVDWTAPKTKASPNVMPPDLLRAVREVSGWVRAKVGESSNDIARLDSPPEDVTTANWQALSDYSAARKLLLAGDIDRKEQALALLHDAVRLDPGFSRAWAELGDNLVSLGLRREGYQAYLTALDGDSGRRLTRKERDFIQGSFAIDTRDYQTAVESFRDLSAFYPNDFDGWFYQAFPLDMLDRSEDANKALNRASALTSVPSATAGQFSYNSMLQGNFTAAQHSIDLVRQAGHSVEADELSGILAFLEGKYDDSDRFFIKNQLSNNYDFRMSGYLMQVRLLAEQGRYTEALTVVTNGLNALGSAANSNNRGLQLIDRSAVEQALGLYRRSIADLEEAFRLNNTADAILLASGLIGRALPHLEPVDRQRAIALLHRMEQAVDSGPAVVDALARAHLRGEVLLSQTRPREAVIAFRKADALDAPLAPRGYLARALLAAAASSSDPADARTLREEALSACGRTALHPALVWRLAWQYPPGEVADQMSSYLTIARSLGRADDETSRVSSAFSRMQARSHRATAPPSPNGISITPTNVQ